MSLTAKHIALIKETAPLVGKNALKITQSFYPAMFEKNPEVLHYFNRKSVQRGTQQEALAHAVIAAANNIDNLTVIEEQTERIGHKHVALSLAPEFYKIVQDNLHLAIKEVCGAQVSAEAGEAWGVALQTLGALCINQQNKLAEVAAKRKGGWVGERKFIVSKISETAKDIKTFVFTPADGAKDEFEYTPGQYLTIRIPALGAAPRHYTITGKSGQTTLEAATKRTKGGRVSSYMHNELKEGQEVLLGVPSGLFTPKRGNAILMSAGSGIMPMVQFLRNIPKNKLKGVLNVAPSEAAQPFLKEFQESGVYTSLHYTEKNDRPDIEAEAKILVQKAGIDANYYVAGPISFKSACFNALKDLGVRNVHYDLFDEKSLK